MSIGFTGYAHLEVEDDETAIYSYSGQNFNLGNDKELKERLEAKRGMFTIRKSALVEPEIHSRVRKTSRGKKLVEKRIVRFPDIGAIIRDGGITIDELCGIDAEGLTYNMGVYQVLLRNIFEEFQKTGSLPEKAAFIV